MTFSLFTICRKILNYGIFLETNMTISYLIAHYVVIVCSRLLRFLIHHSRPCHSRALGYINIIIHHSRQCHPRRVFQPRFTRFIYKFVRELFNDSDHKEMHIMLHISCVADVPMKLNGSSKSIAFSCFTTLDEWPLTRLQSEYHCQNCRHAISASLAKCFYGACVRESSGRE